MSAFMPMDGGRLAKNPALRDTMWLVGLQGLNYLVPLLVWPYLMVVLGAEGFGKIGFALALCQFMMLVVDFGFNLTATKQVALAADKQDVSQITADTMGAKLSLLVVAVSIVAVVLCIPRFAVYRAVTWVMFPMVAGHVFTMQWLFQGLNKIRIVSIVNCACRLCILPLTFLLVKGEGDVLRAAAIQAGTYVLSGMIMVMLTWRMHIVSLCRTNMVRMRNAIKTSLPIFLSNATSSLYATLFVVFLGYFASSQEVGCYTAAEKVMRVCCYIVLLPAVQAYYPRISQMAQTDRIMARRTVKRIGITLSCLMLLAGIALFFFSEQIMSLLGKDYGATQVLFRILAIVPLFVALGGVTGQLGLLAMGGEQDKTRFRNVYFVAACVSLITIFAFAPKWGSAGAAWALLITEATVAAGMCWNYCRLCNR